MWSGRGPGMLSDKPAATLGTERLIPPQSLTTAPSKPHSQRAISSSALFCAQYVPFKRLYAVISVQGRPSRTAISNAVR